MIVPRLQTVHYALMDFILILLELMISTAYHALSTAACVRLLDVLYVKMDL